jgi:hypothetical protein
MPMEKLQLLATEVPFSEDLHQYLESYGAPKLVALLGGESHFG